MHIKVTFVAYYMGSSIQLSRSVVSDSATPWIAASQASLSITNSQSLLKLMSIESVMLSNHLILCYHLILLPSIFPSNRVFSNESFIHIKWLKYWSFSVSISPSNQNSELIPLWLTVLYVLCWLLCMFSYHQVSEIFYSPYMHSQIIILSFV